MITTIGYIRVSTDEQAKEGMSLENQEAKILSYCDLKDLELLEIVEYDPRGIGYAFHGAGADIGGKDSFRSGTIYED